MDVCNVCGRGFVFGPGGTSHANCEETRKARAEREAQVDRMLAWWKAQVHDEEPTPQPEIAQVRRNLTLDEILDEIKHERTVRLTMAQLGYPYHHWQARGDTEAPPQEHWCDYCVGWFGVPHDGHHNPKDEYALCDQVWKTDPGCACIDSIVSRRLRSKITPEVSQ